MKIKVLSVNISEKKDTPKTPIGKALLSEIGIQEDAHSGLWHRQISLLAEESIRSFEIQANRSIKYGEFAENITTQGMELYKTSPMDRLVNPQIELMVTQIGKKCHGDKCMICQELGYCAMSKEGIFAQVLKGGEITVGMEFDYVPRVFKIGVITLSDRASSGVYEDKSGPQIQQKCTDFFSQKYRQTSFEYHLIPDEPNLLNTFIQKQADEHFDVIFTTGGTGIGPRDFTPDVVKSMLTKEIPGIMEHIRVKYGQKIPNALLSRSIAGVIKQTLIFTLPGSVKAVNEYLSEIFPTIEHSVYMIHGLSFH